MPLSRYNTAITEDGLRTKPEGQYFERKGRETKPSKIVLNMETGRFERVPEFPKEAWLEGIVNALCHRSYNLQGNSIYIKHFDDRLEISNSGPLPAQVTVKNIGQERYARNPRIARVLSDLSYVRELNE